MAAIKPTARFTRRAKISLIAIVSWLLLTLAITLRVAGVVADTSNPTLGSAGVASPQSTAAAAAIGSS